MRIAISHQIAIDGVALCELCVESLYDVLGRPNREEQIPMHGGGVRIRESWLDVGISLLRDEKEVVCVMIEPANKTIVLKEDVLPDNERGFAAAYPLAEKLIGHSYSITVCDWLVHLDFAHGSKRRGVGAGVYSLQRVTIGTKKSANQALVTTAMTQTPSTTPTAPLSHL